MEITALKLKRACFAGELDEVRRLLDAGADPNATDEHGSGTLLTFHPAMIGYLLSRGANPNIQTNENGASVLAGLAHVGQLECVFCSSPEQIRTEGARHLARRRCTMRSSRVPRIAVRS